jgi:hypothetical protein
MEKLRKYGKLTLKVIILIIAAIILYRVLDNNAIRVECARKAEDITKNRIGRKDFLEHRAGEFNPKIHEILKGAYEDCLIQAGIF